MKKMFKGSGPTKCVQYIILTAMAIMMLFPLVYAFFSAFKTNTELMAGKTVSGKVYVFKYREDFKFG